MKIRFTDADVFFPSEPEMIDGRIWVNREVTLTENRDIPSVDSGASTIGSSSTRASVGGHSEMSYVIDRGLGGQVGDAILVTETELEEGEIREESGGPEAMETDTSSLVSRMVNRRGQYWRTDQMDFLLKVFASYTHSLRVLQALREEFARELTIRENDLHNRELSVREAERQGILGRSLSTWEASLTAREAELRVREAAYEEKVTTRLRDFLEEIEAWGIRGTILEQPLFTQHLPVIIPSPATVQATSRPAARMRTPSDPQQGAEVRPAGGNADGSGGDPQSSTETR